MTPLESASLCRFAKACCPQQAFDEYTPDAWHELLGDLSFADCKEALTAVVRRQPFVAPAEIRFEVQQVRNRRIRAFGVMPEPPGGLSEAEYHDWHTRTYRAIANGEITKETYVEPELPRRDMRVIQGTFREVTDDDETPGGAA